MMRPSTRDGNGNDGRTDPASRRRLTVRMSRWQWSVVGLCAALAGSVSADIQGPKGEAKGPKKRDQPADNGMRGLEIPTPKGSVVRVFRGRPTEIVLEATAALRQPVEFRLGDPPKHGTLSAVKGRDDATDRATVTYTAKPGVATEDAFTFRVKHKNTATSGSATVRVLIIDAKPQLVAPPTIDFGEALVGESAVRTLPLENRGTAAFIGRLDLPPPWRLLADSPDVEVPAGERIEVRVAFAPLATGQEKFALLYPNSPGTHTTLSGVASSPITIAPTLVQMAWQETTRTRQGEVVLTNRTGSPVDFSLSTSPRLHLTTERGELAPSATLAVGLSLPEGDPAELQTLVTMVSRGTRVEVPLTAPPAPAVLRLRSSEHLDKQGDISVLTATDAAVVFENAGGMAAPLMVVLPAGWKSPAYQNGQDLLPGEVRRLVLVPPASRRGAAAGTLEARLGEQTLRVILQAGTPATSPSAAGTPSRPDALLESQSTAAAPTLPSTSSDDRPASKGEAKVRLMMDTLGMYPAGTTFDNSLPEIPALTHSKVTRTRFTAYWPPVGPGLRYIIFGEQYRNPPGSDRPTRYWIPWAGATYRISPSEVEASLSGLEPGHKYVLRFAVQAADGRIGPVSRPIPLYTPGARQFPWKWLVALAVVGGAWWGWRRWQSQYE